MYITSISPSGYNQFSECQMKYFISYLLKRREPTGAAAEKGTIIHALFEILALHKKAQQDAKEFIEHEVYGGETKALEPMSIDTQDLFNQCWEYYTGKSTHKFSDKDKKEAYKWTGTVFGSSEDPRKLNIISTEQYIKFPIEESWAKYEYFSEKDQKIISGHYTINAIVDLIVREDDGAIKFIDWKALDINTKIPTLSGWTTMGEIKEGEIVFDQYGQQCKVIGKSKVKEAPCYKITFDNKSEVVCDDAHLWKLDNGSTVSILDLKIKDKINVTKPIVTKDIELPIDPYVLGMWLGDGRKRQGEICSGDDFIFEEIKRRGYKLGEDISSYSSGAAQQKTVYGLSTKLRAMGLINNKHIPAIYLRASFFQRLDLLRGLMDSDGNANPYRKQAVFTSCDPNLSLQVKELLLTLGQRPNRCKTIQRGFGLTVEAWPIHFRPIGINPFLLPRKADQIKNEWGPGKSHRRLITSIEKIEQRTVQCIAVDSPDNTFLCTENFIPTHNSGQRKDWISGKKKEYADLFDDIQLNIYYYILKDMYPDETVKICIVYLKDGGAFDLIFTPESRRKTIGKVREKLEQVSATLLPQQNKSWKCKWCFFSKDKLPDAPLEYRKGKFDDIGEKMCICSDVHERLKKNGMNQTIRDLRVENPEKSS